MRRYVLKETVLRQYIREAVISFNYGNIGIGQSSEAQKNSYVVTAAKVLGAIGLVAVGFWVSERYDDWVKKIKAEYEEATKVYGSLKTALGIVTNLPTTLANFNLSNVLPSATTPATPTTPTGTAPSTPAPAAPPATPPAAPPVRESVLRRTHLLREQAATKGYTVISTDYGPLVDTNLKSIMVNNIESAGRMPRILPEPDVPAAAAPIENVAQPLNVMIDRIVDVFSYLNSASDTDKDPLGLARRFRISGMIDTDTLAKVEGISDGDPVHGAQKKIAKMFMYDALTVFIFDKLVEELLENIGYVVEKKTKGRSNLSDEDQKIMEKEIEKFCNTLTTKITSKLSDFVEKLVSGEVFKE